MAAGWLWAVSRALYGARLHRLAKVVKAVNFLLNSTLLPYQARVGEEVKLWHHGLGVVIHPNVSLGDRVHVWHGVTIAAETRPGSPYRVRVEDDVVLGAHCILVGRGDEDLTIGRGARIGAGAVVTRDVPPEAVVVGTRARPLPQ